MSVHTLSAHLHMCTYVHIESSTNIHEKWGEKDGSRGEEKGAWGRRELFSNNSVSPPETVGVTDERPLSIEVKTAESCTQLKRNQFNRV